MISQSDYDSLLKRFNRNPSASPASLREFETVGSYHLPQDYLRFLSHSNGGEGFIGDSYLILWKLEELRQLNDAYEVSQYAPGLIFFGSDGGGNAYAFDARSRNMPIVSVPFIGMQSDQIELLGTDFKSFLVKLSTI